MNKGLFQSASVEWHTPVGVFEELEKEFGRFDLDPCATAESSKGTNYYPPTDLWSGLIPKWEGKVFLNPPYGRGIKDWIKKAWESGEQGALVVCLIPCRTDTSWWHDYVMKSREIRFIRGRLKFMKDGAPGLNSAPFPSCIVVFGGYVEAK